MSDPALVLRRANYHALQGSWSGTDYDVFAVTQSGRVVAVTEDSGSSNAAK